MEKKCKSYSDIIIIRIMVVVAADVQPLLATNRQFKSRTHELKVAIERVQ